MPPVARVRGRANGQQGRARDVTEMVERQATHALVDDLVNLRVPREAPAPIIAATVRARDEPEPILDSEKPKKLSDLGEQFSRAYDLSVNAAADLSIPIVTSVSGGLSRRVVILERSAFASIPRKSATYHFGYAIRLAVTISQTNGSLKLALPFLAASAQLGQIEASWIMQVIGLAGPKIDAVAITPSELSVETFMNAKQSLAKLIDAVHDTHTRLIAQQVGVVAHSDMLMREYVHAIARTYALGCIERHRTLSDALSDLHGVVDGLRDGVADSYQEFAGITDTTVTPEDEAQRRAAELLHGIKVEPR